MQPLEIGPHRYHTRRRALIEREQLQETGNMEERHDGSPPRNRRNNDDQDTREFYRAMVIG